VIVWLFGRYASGKTSIAQPLYTAISKLDHTVSLLEATELRATLWPELGSSPEDLKQSSRRLAATADMIARHGGWVIVCDQTPFRDSRRWIKKKVGDRIQMIFVDTPVSTCRNRDHRGIYAKGASMSFETPLANEHCLRVQGDDPVSVSLLQIITWLNP
jgi:bifunctional enzyme CysN/CysC